MGLPRDADRVLAFSHGFRGCARTKPQTPSPTPSPKRLGHAHARWECHRGQRRTRTVMTDESLEPSRETHGQQRQRPSRSLDPRSTRGKRRTGGTRRDTVEPLHVEDSATHADRSINLSRCQHSEHCAAVPQRHRHICLRNRYPSSPSISSGYNRCSCVCKPCYPQIAEEDSRFPQAHICESSET